MVENVVDLRLCNLLGEELFQFFASFRKTRRSDLSRFGAHN